MKKLRLLSLAGLFAIGMGATAATPAVGSTALQQRSNASSYTDGYNQGFNETVQNKCIDGDRFESNYSSSYEPRAQQNYDNSIGTTYEDYYRGYLDGLHDGYNAPAYCR